MCTRSMNKIADTPSRDVARSEVKKLEREGNAESVVVEEGFL